MKAIMFDHLIRAELLFVVISSPSLYFLIFEYKILAVNWLCRVFYSICNGFNYSFQSDYMANQEMQFGAAILLVTETFFFYQGF
jgi:hypothetical protein